MSRPLRIVASIALPVLAALLGFVLTNPPTKSGLGQRLAAWPDIVPPTDYSNSIDRIIGEISNMYLFGRDPSALPNASNSTDNLALQQEDGLDGVTLFAIIARDGQPAGVLADDELGVLSVVEGDRVANSWTVTSISKDTLVVSREGEFKTLSLLSAIEDGQR